MYKKLDLKNTFIKSFVFSLGFCLTCFMFAVGYATRTNLTTVTSSDSLTVSRWNDVINNLNNIGTRVDGVNQAGGNVGIGTSSPTTKLDVNGSVKAADFIGNASSASNVAWTGVTNRPTNISSFTNDSGYITGVVDNRVNTTGDNLTGNLNVSGNVGIGTTGPSQKLEVVGGSIKATGGFIIETRTTNPTSPETGRMWLINP